MAVCLGGGLPADFRAGRQFLSVLFPALHRHGHLPVLAGERDRPGTAEPADHPKLADRPGSGTIDPASLRGAFSVLVRASFVRSAAVLDGAPAIRDLGCHQSRRSRRASCYPEGTGRSSWETTRRRPLLAPTYL